MERKFRKGGHGFVESKGKEREGKLFQKVGDYWLIIIANHRKPRTKNRFAGNANLGVSKYFGNFCIIGDRNCELYVDCTSHGFGKERGKKGKRESY
jgi:hypothetical protein